MKCQRIYNDEAVATGAAILGAQLHLGSQSALLVVDVAPLSLGVVGRDGRIIRLIERNTAIPVEKKLVLTRAEDNQSSVLISVYQGESESTKHPNNLLLGQFQLDGLRPAQRGQPSIEVTFALDANGILDVTAKDLETDKSKILRMFTTSGLTPAEVERLYTEAEQERLIRGRFND
jgi:molecular chaperone DnaK